jgi:hypothetical protein
MRELRRKAVYAYQFIPLRRGAAPARHNFTVDNSERMHGFAILPRPRVRSGRYGEELAKGTGPLDG